MGKRYCSRCYYIRVKADHAAGLIPPEDCIAFVCKYCKANRSQPKALRSKVGAKMPQFCDPKCKGKFFAEEKKKRGHMPIAKKPADRRVLHDEASFSNFRSRNCILDGQICRRYLQECLAGGDFIPRNRAGGCYEPPGDSCQGHCAAVNPAQPVASNSWRNGMLM